MAIWSRRIMGIARITVILNKFGEIDVNIKKSRQFWWISYQFLPQNSSLWLACVFGTHLTPTHASQSAICIVLCARIPMRTLSVIRLTDCGYEITKTVNFGCAVLFRIQSRSFIRPKSYSVRWPLHVWPLHTRSIRFQSHGSWLTDFGSEIKRHV